MAGEPQDIFRRAGLHDGEGRTDEAFREKESEGAEGQAN